VFDERSVENPNEEIRFRHRAGDDTGASREETVLFENRE
jgi:hypothetical protein